MIILQYNDKQRDCSHPFHKPAGFRTKDYAQDHYYVVIDDESVKCIQLDRTELESPELSIEFVARCILDRSWVEVTEPNPWMD